MTLQTRVDKLVWLRERSEEAALLSLARARFDAERAREGVARAVEAARADARAAGAVDLWILHDDGHRRAVQRLRRAEGEAREAVVAEEAARREYVEACQGTRAVQRVQERRRSDLRTSRDRRDRRELDETATLRFNAAR